MTATSQWRPATVVSRKPAADDMVAIRMEPEESLPHEAGQHYEIRFPNAELSRKFSIVSSPAKLPSLEVGVQILPTGMVSPRLAQVKEGDHLEIRGPLGRAFVWSPDTSKNLLLLGAGAGITPLLSMWTRFHEAADGGTCRFVVSAKSPGRVYRYDHYCDELELRFTADEPRLSKRDVAAVLSRIPTSGLSVRICGPSGFITTMADALIELGIDENRIRSEGFA